MRSFFYALTIIFCAVAAASAQPDRDAQQPDNPALAASDRPFSLLDFGEIISIGFSLGYLSYKESFDQNDFSGLPSDRVAIVGAPKSAEYGDLFGIHTAATFYSWENRLFFRPKASVLVGYGNTYDGSTQGQPTFDSAGNLVKLEYDPSTFKKNNIFVWAGGDIGYCFPAFKFPFVIYTGIDFKLWYRNLMDYQGQLFYSTDFSNSETYYWFSAPLGIIIEKPLTPRYTVGLDMRVDLMFHGGMSVSMNTGAADSATTYPSVTLGNRPSVRVEMFLQKRTKDNLSTKLCPYFVWYGFNKSNTANAVTSVGTNAGGVEYATPFYEPTSNSFLFGITFSMEFLKKQFR